VEQVIQGIISHDYISSRASMIGVVPMAQVRALSAH
jgi:hypothetical protein